MGSATIIRFRVCRPTNREHQRCRVVSIIGSFSMPLYFLLIMQICVNGQQTTDSMDSMTEVSTSSTVSTTLSTTISSSTTTLATTPSTSTTTSTPETSSSTSSTSLTTSSTTLNSISSASSESTSTDSTTVVSSSLSTSSSPSPTSYESTDASTTTSTTTKIPIPSTSQSTTTPLVATTPENHTSLIVGVVVGVGGFLIICTIIIVAVILLKYRNKDRDKRQRGSPIHLTPKTGTLTPQEVVPPKPVPERPVPVTNFLQYVMDHQSRMQQYHEEFGSLPDNRVKSRIVASDESLSIANRYTNILPYDENRVKLESSNPQDSDYINASFINGLDGEKAYVATQGPLDVTIDSFWKMVWQLKSDRIAMVTNLVEDCRIKCAQYWPKSVMEPMNCGEITVKLVEEYTAPLFTIRQISLHKESGENRQVELFHFTSWPDHGVPETCTSLLKFYRLIFRSQTPLKNPTAPVIVHCSAGVGRSGTLISLDLILRKAEKTGCIDIPKCVEGLRLQRMFMVQTLAQYIYIHHAVLEWMLLGDVTIPCSPHLGDEIENLYKINSKSGKSRLQSQYEVLDVLMPKYGENLFSVAMREQNMNKNRSPSVLPVDHNCLSLIEVEEDENTYINAVFVPGYERPDKPQSNAMVFISTQSPLASTTSDFWRLVKDNNCVAIIMLNDVDTSNNNNTERYWPTDGRSTKTGRFTVTNTGPEIMSDNVLVTPLQIVYEGKIKNVGRGTTTRVNMEDDSDTESEGSTDDGISLTKIKPSLPVEPVYDNIAQTMNEEKPIIVQHIRILNWANDSAFPTDMSTLLTLYSKVADCRRQNPSGRIVVHCLNGAERSGLFFALLNTMECIHAEREVDVYNSVKRIRSARPEFVVNIDQYRFIYELARCQQVSSRSIPEPEVDYPIYANSSAL